MRINYLLDYTLTAIVVASFWCLTVWRDRKTNSRRSWAWALGFGLCLGLGMMTKQSVLFFLFFPLLWVGVTILRQRDWGKIAGLCSALVLSIFIFGPWYSTNWIYFFGNHQSGIVDAAIKEGDPPLNTLAAWTYYF